MFIEKRILQCDVNVVHDADIHDGKEECQALSCKESTADNTLFLTFLITQKVCTQIGTIF